MSRYDNTAENEQFRLLCEKLSARFGKQGKEFCVFVGNYNIGCELDALLIKEDAIIVIEFKNYGGHIVANQNGDWTADGIPIDGGARNKTVLKQAETNHSIVKGSLQELGVDPKQFKDLPTLIVFHQPITKLDNFLLSRTKSWLHITDDEHFLDKIEDITCRRTDLIPRAIVELAQKLGLNDEFLFENYSNVWFGNSDEQSAEMSPANLDSLEPEEHVDKDENVGDCHSVDVSNERDSVQTQQYPPELNADGSESRGYEVDDGSTDKLKSFISNIMSVNTNRPFNIEIFKFEDEGIDAVFHGHEFSKEYIIKIESEDISGFALKIGKFIGREIFILAPNCIYFEYGKDVVPGDNNNLCNSVDLLLTEDINLRKSKTSLPDWLDRKIFGEMGAVYAPEHQRYEFNLDLDEHELRVYLGTYFPRSYAEMFCIADNLFQNEKYNKIFSGEGDEINILDCGCGTGGEIIGLITAICKYFPQSRLNITAVDGNEGALQILEEIINGFPSRFCRNIKITTINNIVAAENDLEMFNNLGIKYQFILCNKMVCELISKNILNSEDAYAILAEVLSLCLSDNGLLTILDVTTKDEHSGYFYPQLMNRSLNRFVSKSRAIGTLLPLSCSFNDSCDDLCFMQQTFLVSHSRKDWDESRVSYRVMCMKSLKNSIIGGTQIDRRMHLIHSEKYKQNDASAVCMRTMDGGTLMDSFNLDFRNA